MSWRDTQTDRKFDRCLGGTRRQTGSLIDVLERETLKGKKLQRQKKQ